MATSWNGRNLRCRSGRKGIQQYLDSGHNGANEPWPWLRRFSSREISCGITRVYQYPPSAGIFVSLLSRDVSNRFDRRRQHTFNFTATLSPASKPTRRWTTADPDDPAIDFDLSSVFSSLSGNLGSVYSMFEISSKLLKSICQRFLTNKDSFSWILYYCIVFLIKEELLNIINGQIRWCKETGGERENNRWEQWQASNAFELWTVHLGRSSTDHYRSVVQSSRLHNSLFN